jgi:hypothetical protein
MSIIQTLSVKNIPSKSNYWAVSLWFIFISIISITSITPVFAQQLKPLKWPKTFSGQPDFDFRREEILKEFQEKGGIEGVKSTKLATMKRLLQTTIVDPFKPNTISKSATESSKNSNKINKAALAALFGDVPANLSGDNNGTQLPGFNKTSNLDLTEFAIFLDNVINQKVKLNKTTLKGRDFSTDLQRVVIQSIATSPVKYTIINNNKFSVGDRFLLPIKSKIYDSEIEALLAPYLPQPESFSKDVYQKYVDVKNDAIEKYKSENSDGKASVVTHNVSITIRDILHRKVKVSVYGHEYELKIRYAF